MALSSVLPVEIHRVGGVESLHEFAEIGLTGRKYKVKMLIHEDVGVDLDVVEMDGGFEDLQKSASVRVIPEDGASSISPACHMIPGTRVFYSERSGHKKLSIRRRQICQLLTGCCPNEFSNTIYVKILS